MVNDINVIILNHSESLLLSYFWLSWPTWLEMSEYYHDDDHLRQASLVQAKLAKGQKPPNALTSDHEINDG